MSGTSADRDDLKAQMVTLLDRTAPAITVDEVRQRAETLNAAGIMRHRRPRRMNTYALGAAAMATAICVLVVVLVFGFGVSSAPKPTVAPARPAFVPASWQKVTFGGLTMYAPGDWPVGSEQSWGDCGLTSQPFFKDNSVELDTGASAVVYHCPAISPTQLVPPVNGLLVDPGPVSPLDGVNDFDKCMTISGLSVCPVTPGYTGILVLAVHIPGRVQPVAVEIGLAGGGNVAHIIEYSMRASGSKVPPTTPTTVPLSLRAKPCANGAVAVKPGPPTDSMTEMLDVAITVEFVDLSSRQCTVRGLPRYFDQLPNGGFVPMVERYAYFGAGTAPPSSGVPVLLTKDGGGFASFKLSDMTVSGPNTCHDPGTLVIQAPGQSARTQVADYEGGLTVCPNDQVLEQAVSAVDPFFDADHPSP